MLCKTIIFIFSLVVIVVAFVLLKKVVSCLLKSVIMLAIIGALAYIYFTYFMQ